MSRLARAAALLSLLVVAVASATGCKTEAYCFVNCGDASTSGATSTGGEGGSLTTSVTGAGGDICLNCGGGGGGDCLLTNGGIEICDKIDNDCNGAVDDLEGIDLASAKTCGTCDNDCYAQLANTDPVGVTCEASAQPGLLPGVCHCDGCATDYHDLDGDCNCEYYCLASAADDALCNHKDDDCDGLKDEDVDLCASTTDCGVCGRNCVVIHGTPLCAQTGGAPCDAASTQCQILSCDCVPGSCWWDLDGSYATGCEYQCALTNGGVEICGDSLDNDCDGKIDEADDLSLDPAVGVTCYGDPDGECAMDAHAGVSACIANQVVCTGAAVLGENQLLEVCNSKDDDCDGVVDDAPSDAGAACGTSNIFPCSLGTQQCVNGAITCLGAVDPTTETCNGVDDDCDGQTDKTGAMPPADSVGACNIPPPAPAGVTQPCQGGSKACTAGAVVCAGSIGATSPVDGCGDDSNCDGLLTSQPDLQTDPAHCGTCVNDCYANSVHALWGCTAGACQFTGCQPGYFDLDGDQKCEYACTFLQAQETCNGADDNCNGQTDEGLQVPSPVQVCGVSPSALSAACTSSVTVACTLGTWTCTFPAGVCGPTCAGATEVCDTLDNDCDGFVNENVPSYNQPCASDDASPTPGDGACRTTGTHICNGPNATICTAVKASCASLGAGCTEQCDGIDNDCDGLTDESFAAKGPDAANFVKPVVTKLANNSFIYAYEASRPSATSTTSGTGNGYHCAAPPCPGGAPQTPASTPTDKTPSCSVANKIPWFGVTPAEVEQTCTSMGGSVCSTATWTTACQATSPCTWGYSPRGVAASSACNTAWVADPPGASLGKFCNLAVSYDFDAVAAGSQQGLLPTASSLVQNCWADWTGTSGNAAGSDKLFDVTGNLREVTKSAASTYPLMGGAFTSGSEAGSTCSFQFYTVDAAFSLYDQGFRCCFTTDPRL